MYQGLSEKLLVSSLDLLNTLRQVGLKPHLDVKAFRAIKFDRVAMEEVRHHHKVAIGSELIGNELGVYGDTDDISENEHRVVGGLVFGVGEVGWR